jgi:hypothetical protein
MHGERQPEPPSVTCVDDTLEKVHLRGTNEPSHKKVIRVVVELERGARGTETPLARLPLCTCVAQ